MIEVENGGVPSKHSSELVQDSPGILPHAAVIADTVVSFQTAQ